MMRSVRGWRGCQRGWPLTHALAGIFSSGMLDVIAMGDGKRKLI